MLDRKNKITIISFILTIILMCILGYLIIAFIPNTLDVEEISKLLEEKYKTVELEQYDWIIFVNEENFENISKIEEIL